MTEPRTYGLTQRADDLIAFLRWHIGEHGTAPSYDQMAARLGLKSKSGIHRLLAQLVERGAVRWLPGRHRSIQLTDAQTFRLPAALAAYLAADASLCGVPVERHLADAVRAYLLPVAARQQPASLTRHEPAEDHP